jgi:hypothetical protein
MKSKLKQSLLAVLNACDGLPMPESALVSAAQLYARPDEPTDSDVRDALQELERKRYAAAVTDELTQERTWTLTVKGTHRAREIR